MKKIFLLLTFLTSLFAQNDYDLRVAYGRADSHDLAYIAVGDMAPDSAKGRVLMLDAGYKMVDNAFKLPLDIYIQGGFAKFLENGYADDVYENTLYIKGYYNFDFWQNKVRLGAGEGASYAYGTLYVEKLESEKKGGNLSHYLNYLELSLDCDLGKLVKYEPLNDLYLGFVIKHRSGVFGLINNVKHGGSNYEAVYLEKKF
jgi:outer membrane protein